MRVRFPSAALLQVSRRAEIAWDRRISRPPIAEMVSRYFGPLSLLASLALATLVLTVAGCGGSGGSAGDGDERVAGSAPGDVDWPYFGRVPERTHYLPADERALDPPLRQAWSINTHALIEFPPAISGGVAYVINKFGNGKAVRLSDRRVLWELKLRPSDKGHQLDVTAPVYHQGRVFGTFLDGYVAAGDRVRQGLRGSRRRHRLRLRREERQGRLVLRERRPGLRLAGDRRSPRHARDRLHRLRKRNLLRARREDGQAALEVRRRRPDSGHGDGDRRHRLHVEL